MIQTHLLPLQPPYNYIYYGGIVGKQIATLVATVDKTDKEGNYGLETHSHPVVVYNGQTAEGVVWDKCEVMDCRTVCSEKEKSVTLRQFNELLAMTGGAKTDNPNNPMNLLPPMNPNYLRSALRAAGIALELPQDVNYYGIDQPGTIRDFKVKLLFDASDDGLCVWSQLNQSPLYFNIEAAERKEVLSLLKAQLYDWQMALEEFCINIEFEAGKQEDVYDDYIEFDEDEVNGIIEKLNNEAKRK